MRSSASKAESVAYLTMFAEHYLDLESSESHKMSLEITTAWNCRPVTI